LEDNLDRLSRERLGSVLSDKWTIEKLLGVGGMAAVYAARHRNGARAAIKVLHPDLSRNKEVRERFRREGYAANLVEHPGVVKVLDDDVVASGALAGTVYLVMELLTGQLLQDRLENGPPMGEIEFLEIAVSVLDVLDAAHARGVIHRDLKPENLFLSQDESGETAKRRVKVLDFGLARLQEGQSITTHGLALGTPSFMSPEQAAGHNDKIDGRTDLFALAATGFRIRSGRKIHDAANPIELVTKMASLPAPKMRTVCKDVSEPFARVIDRALEFRREDRYASAATMAEDARRALAELDTATTRRDSGPPPLALAIAPVAEATIEVRDSDIVRPQYGLDESIRIPKRRSLLPWIALLVIAAAGTKVWFDRFRPNAPAPPAASGAAPVVQAETSPDAGMSTPDGHRIGALDAGPFALPVVPKKRGAGAPLHLPRPPPPPGVH
jgi:serine/threonine-protein kinase